MTAASDPARPAAPARERSRRRAHRVPQRLQFTRTECAAACLAMVLSHYGRDSTVADCRPLLGAGRDGASAAVLVDAARQAGLTVRVDRGPAALEQPLRGPVIAYLRTHHFVVLERVDRRSVRLVDPAGGRRQISRQDFDGLYGGVTVALEPGESFEERHTPLRDRPMVRYLRRFLAAPGGRSLLALTALVTGLLQLLGLAVPLLTRTVVDSLLPQHRTDLPVLLALSAVGIALLTGLLTALRALALLALRRRGDLVLTRSFVEHLFRLPLRFFLERGRGDLLMRTSSVSSTRETLTQQLMTVALDGVLLVGYLVAVVLLQPLYLLAVAPLFLLQLLLVVHAHRRLRNLAQLELVAKAEEQSYLVEALEAILPLKANGVESRAVEHWQGLFTRYQGAMLRRGRATAGLSGAQRAMTSLGPLLMLGVGAWMVMTGRSTLGTMLAANSLVLSVLAPLETLSTTGQLYLTVNAQVERLFDVLDAPAETGGRLRLTTRKATSVDVRALTFRYQASGPPALSGIDLSVPAGGKLGIVGRTGSGKSTLALLLLGLLPPDEGTVRHDGVPIDRLDLADLRAHCGAVLQELSLFGGSIRDNLTLGRPDAEDSEVVRAARIAGLHEDVLALPMGYDTPVGESGSALSAGQRQRVALARALVHRPRLLLLDEATSHLDPQTERHVDGALAELAVTRIVVSHRLNAVRNADQILVLEHGRIVQRGRHDELIEQEGAYRLLFGAADTDVRPAASR
ncbi:MULTISPECIES: peptidase domain-containing ABC transporter [Streptomycetaceae]|uniref:peptidase domain-containing ABC transporter n=1 Tax=Streptomycetaceae TaxID=2062 RepID=UPI0009A1B72B|nr:peptidase domain-containing ABC transporter [Streptomyces sp. CB02056]